MAYPIEGGSILEVAFEGTLDGQQFVSLFHYWLSEEFDLSDGRQGALDALNIINNAGGLLQDYRQCIVDTVADLQVYGQWITPTRYRYVQDPAGPYAGLVPGNSQPANVSIAITKQGEQANRHNQGTLHMPAVPLTFVTASEVVAVVAGGVLDDLCEQIPEQIVLPGGQELDPVLFNRLEPNESAYIVFADWETASRVMRRRTKGVGT